METLIYYLETFNETMKYQNVFNFMFVVDE